MAFSSKPPLWRRVFLRALGLGASVAAASRHAGIGARQPYAYRKKNPHFAKLWADAQMRGRRRLQSGKPPAILEDRPRPLAVIRSINGKSTAIPIAEQQWDDGKEAKFLEVLAATANVTAAAIAVGASLTSLYRRRSKWPAFREAWDEAKAYAVDRLDFMLIEAATNLFDPPEVPCPDPVPVSFDQAMKLVCNAREINRRGEAKRLGWRRKPVDMDALSEEIIHKLGVIRKHNAQ